jgi:hypothetical protein
MELTLHAHVEQGARFMPSRVQCTTLLARLEMLTAMTLMFFQMPAWHIGVLDK